MVESESFEGEGVRSELLVDLGLELLMVTSTGSARNRLGCDGAGRSGAVEDMMVYWSGREGSGTWIGYAAATSRCTRMAWQD